MTYNTGWNTPNWVVWDGEPIHRTPDNFPKGTANANGTVTPVGGLILPLESIASFPASVGEHSGYWHARAWIDTAWGLSMSELRFNEMNSGNPIRSHCLAEFLQWRNVHLVFLDATTQTEHIEKIPIGSATITNISIFPNGGTRQSIPKKQFAWGVSVISVVGGLKDPRSSDVTYNVTLTHTYLVAAPDNDQDPGGAVLAIKVFPTLTISLQAMYRGRPLQPFEDDWTLTSPDIGADLKMVHAPALTRDADASKGTKVGDVLPHEGQRRKDAQYKPLAGKPSLNPKDVFAYAVNDSNDTSRPNPGGTPPTPPNWDYMFDYINPRIQCELAFDAVIWPRFARPSTPQDRPSFDVHWDGAAKVLTCFREPGQGEYDNLHISPYLGFDDPNNADPAGPATDYPLVEAPIAADETIHLHWRWGTANPDRADNVKKKSGATFKGWSDGWPSEPGPSEPNQVDGAPLIPAHHSLRIKVARAWPLGTDDATGPANTTTPLDPMKIAVWYSTIAHSPPLGALTQFFGHGYSLAYYLIPITAMGGILEIKNWELLTGNHGYHAFRWNNANAKQRVPSASDVPDITQNKLRAIGPIHARWENNQWYAS